MHTYIPPYNVGLNFRDGVYITTAIFGDKNYKSFCMASAGETENLIRTLLFEKLTN